MIAATKPLKAPPQALTPEQLVEHVHAVTLALNESFAGQHVHVSFWAILQDRRRMEKELETLKRESSDDAMDHKRRSE